MQHIILHKKQTLRLPENINEVSATQYLRLCAIVHSGITMLQAHVLALRVLCGLNMWQWWRLHKQYKAACLPYVKWVFDDWNNTRQLLPKYRGFYGVKTELDNLTLSEFYFTELYFSQYKNGDDAALNSLCAVLYRPGKFAYNKVKDVDGDQRKPFNANLTAYYTRRTAKWPMYVKQGIASFYAACQAKIAADNPKIFTGNNNSNDGAEADMFGILRSLSGGRYGDFEKVERMLLHNALHEMNMVVEENDRMEEEMKKRKTA